jgi:hypothetical protein
LFLQLGWNRKEPKRATGKLARQEAENQVQQGKEQLGSVSAPTLRKVREGWGILDFIPRGERLSA